MPAALGGNDAGARCVGESLFPGCDICVVAVWVRVKLRAEVGVEGGEAVATEGEVSCDTVDC